jgi:3-phenylpropionate/trans-cinnamate dioxygenase ferredoxin reductase component
MDAIVIVGAGHCGGRTALALRAAGWAGPVVLIGEEAEAPYERPPLSKGVLLGEPFAAALAPGARFAEGGIDWLASRRVEAIDRAANQVVLDDGRRIDYRALLLATGGHARTLAIPGAGLEGIHTLRTLADANALAPKLMTGARIAVIGGGFIGLEVAASAAARGCRVTVVEAAPRLLGRAAPASIAGRVQALHEARGVEVRLGIPPIAFERCGKTLRVRLADGTAFDADTIVVGIGIAPNSGLAERASLRCANGIVVDAQLRSADPRIFAAGDVAAFPSPLSLSTHRLESWHNAEDHARVAAANLAGGSASVSAAPWFWSDQFDHQLQIAGDPSLGRSAATRTLAGGAAIDFHLDAEGRIVGIAGFGPTSALAKEFKLARMLFERGVHVDAQRLSDPAVKLKSLLGS